MVSTTKTRFSVGVMTRVAILAAAASILFLIQIPIVAFYKLDLSNIPVLLGAFSMGPVPGMMILALKSLIGLLSSSSAGIGELADFIMGAALVLPAALIYQQNKTRKSAIIGMAVGTLCMVIAGVLANKYIMLPFYMGAFHMDMDGILRFANSIAFSLSSAICPQECVATFSCSGICPYSKPFCLYKSIKPLKAMG